MDRTYAEIDWRNACFQQIKLLEDFKQQKRDLEEKKKNILKQIDKQMILLEMHKNELLLNNDNKKHDKFVKSHSMFDTIAIAAATLPIAMLSDCTQHTLALRAMLNNLSDDMDDNSLNNVIENGENMIMESFQFHLEPL